MKNKPYVVSADIYLLLGKWARQKKFILPEKEFFAELRRGFSSYMFQMFSNFELISEGEISKHIQNVTIASKLHSVSLDQIYFSSNSSIELTRNVNLQGEDRGIQHRFGNPNLLRQLRQLKVSGIKEVCLVDDVIFSGVLIERVIKLLSNMEISVPVVCAGIGIQEGIDRIICNKREVICKKVYEEVIDEVCERDFYLGVPFSGRSLIGSENVGLPYILPFGKPREWASIPLEFQKAFSEFCINQTVVLFEEIQKISNKKVCCSDIERKVPGQPKNANYIDFLESITND